MKLTHVAFRLLALLTLCAVGFSLIVGVGCSSRSSSSDDCSELEPENPYEEGSGHYAGFEWAENNPAAPCSGNSSSFVEGCEKYHEQLNAYKACLEKR